jgi:RNA polymerase sigma-70 factor (ECF subfamily)
MTQPDQTDPTNPSGGYYPTTLWTQILMAKADPVQSEAAWRILVQRYQHPIRAQIEKYLRNYDPENLAAQFISDRFKARLIPEADRHKGRFRDFLAAALRDYITDQLRKVFTAKRGAGALDIPLDALDHDTAAAGMESAEEFSRDFDRQFAREFLKQAVERFREIFIAQRRKKASASAAGTPDPAEEFEWLIGKESHRPIAEIAQRIGKKPGAIKADRSRWNRELRAHLRAEVAQLVTPEEAADELLHLLKAAGWEIW